ncbi:MAG: hypothetical protein V7L14_19080 [Nostoc sp.]|uniref:hypothetical protein n=1 Tax=Nostoc sp. TaxID=1180 RepID=UPI002FF90BC1
MFEITLQETRVYREAKEEGRQEGLKQALEEIREKGREQGIQQGRTSVFSLWYFNRRGCEDT